MLTVTTTHAAAIVREFQRAQERAAKNKHVLRACADDLFSLQDTTLGDDTVGQQVLLDSLDQVWGYLKGFEVGQARMAARREKAKGG